MIPTLNSVFRQHLLVIVTSLADKWGNGVNNSKRLISKFGLFIDLEGFGDFTTTQETAVRSFIVTFATSNNRFETIAIVVAKHIICPFAFERGNLSGV